MVVSLSAKGLTTGEVQARWTLRRKTALNALDVTFDGRLSAARQ
ncbi:hypothetical protein [Streptomyces sp. NPDC001744]